MDKTKTLTSFNKRHKLTPPMLIPWEEKRDLKRIRESRILPTRNHRISQYNPLFKMPQNKLGMKTQKKADMTYKSTKNIQIARSGDNVPSTRGTNARATPKWHYGNKPPRRC